MLICNDRYRELSGMEGDHETDWYDSNTRRGFAHLNSEGWNTYMRIIDQRSRPR